MAIHRVLSEYVAADNKTAITPWHEEAPGGTTNTAALTAASAKANSSAQPATDATTGRFVFNDPYGVNRSSVHKIRFAIQDANNETGVARVWGWEQVGDTWAATHLLDVTVTAGAKTGFSGAPTAAPNATWFLCDAATIDADYTIGTAAVEGGVADGWCSIAFDAGGAPVIEVECSLNGETGAGIRVWHRGI